MSTPSSGETIAVQGQWPDDELFVLDYLLATLTKLDGSPIGFDGLGTETPDWPPESEHPEFVQVTAEHGRGGVRADQTSVSAVLIQIHGPSRRAVKALSNQVTAAMLALDRGGLHRGIQVDACYSTEGDASEVDRDDDDRRRSQLWGLEWRPHFGPTVATA